MHHQNPQRSRSDGLPVCRHGWRRPWHTSGYVSPREHMEHDGSVVWKQESPALRYYTADSDLTPTCVWTKTDSCLTEGGGDFGEAHACRVPDGPGVWVDTPPQTGEPREAPPGGRHPNEASERTGHGLGPCKSGHPAWVCGMANQCPCLPPACFNVTKTLVVGVEVDVLEELIYEDVEVLDMETAFDGGLEQNLMDSTSFCCDQLFLK
ncbi:hypothetical protein P4O66_014053 [Electrophorus voltai]|uniref:Uncharacterized protein n=1 Tax=Electrophorus voltai TaxID=2609070 RepID=A0AAD9DRU6_9TELE|nr:hypothetical protein P4O66_014053 [Electrophorus voltai]